MDDNVFDDIDDVNEEHHVEDSDIMTNLSDGWEDYVMSHFKENELYDGNPKVNGLRRVAESLIGPIHTRLLHTVQSPSAENGYIATVECELGFVDKVSAFEKYVSDVADASPVNCAPPFSLHLSAMAGTRAYARALRSMLCLSKVSAEEVAVPKEAVESLEKLSNSQEIGIDNLAKKLDVNVAKLVLSLGLNPMRLSKADGSKIVGELQRGTLPEDVKGYVNWR